MRQRALIGTAAALVLALAITSVALAARNPSGTGQPSQTCVTTPTAIMEPGNASAAPGSAFNEDPGGVAGGAYAGDGAHNQINSDTVSQYDVACYQVTGSQTR
jgi:hypothetical protein